MPLHSSLGNEVRLHLKKKEKKETQHTKTYRILQKDYKREVYSNKHLHQKVVNFQMNNLMSYLKELKKQGQTKSNISKKKLIIKIRTKIYYLKTKNNTKDQ